MYNLQKKKKVLLNWDSVISFSSTIADGSLYTCSRGKLRKQILPEQINFSLFPPSQV